MEEVKLAIKPFYQKREVTKDEYKDILRKAVQKVSVGGWAAHTCASGTLVGCYEGWVYAVSC